MNLRSIVGAVASLAVLVVQAQNSPPPAGATPRVGGAVSAAEQTACRVAARRTLHDHGIERGYGPMPIKKCNAVVARNATETGALPRHERKPDKSQ